MQFIHPQFLYALAFLAIPILIHLFNFKKTKTVYFSNISWLKQVDQQTKAQSKIKHWLLLLTRLLLLTAIIFAFAQPYIPGNKENSNAERFVSIYIDNSFSMEGDAQAGQLLDIAKQYAYNIVTGYGSSHKFQILSNDFLGKQQRFVSSAKAEQWITEIELSPALKNLNQVLERQKNALANSNSNIEHYIISDFQNGFGQTPNLEYDRVNLIPILRENVENISIDSAYFSSPIFNNGKSVSLAVRYTNNSNRAYNNIPVTLSISGVQKAFGNVSLEPKEQKWKELPFTPIQGQYQLGLIQIQSDPINFDNSLYFNFELKDQINIYHIYSKTKNKGINTLYNKEGYAYQAVTENTIDLDQALSADMLILDELELLSSGHIAAIKDFANNGGTLVLIPSTNLRLSNNLLSSLNQSPIAISNLDSLRIGNLELQHPLFHQVFNGKVDKPIYPVFKQFFESRFEGEQIIKLENGAPLLGVFDFGKGQVFQFFAPLNVKNSDFIKNNLFVPTFINLAFLSQDQSKLFYTLGQDKLIPTKSTNAVTLNIKNEQFDFIVEQSNQQFLAPSELRVSGHYNVIHKEKRLSGLSFNYNRSESDLSFWNLGQIKDFVTSQVSGNWKLVELEFDQIQAEIKLQNTGVSYWKLCVIFALGFLLIETLLMRIFN
ncbi:MAG: hypothetical protein ACI8P7_001144 [Candidatus Azotimanducaceae bacterium]|jgi:hypothetical protein